jgi:hypothetical protein
VLHVWAGVAHVAAAVHGPGRLDLYAVKRAGEAAPLLSAEAYAADGLVAGGELQVWELNQAIAALLSRSGQARRLALRSPEPRGHGGYLDVVADEDVVEIVATSADGGRRVAFSASAVGLAASLNTLLHHYLALNRPADSHIVVLPDAEAQPASARAALIRPAP